MKADKISFWIGLSIMAIACLLDPSFKSQMFLKFFGVGIGLTLTYSTGKGIDAIINLLKKPKS